VAGLQPRLGVKVMSHDIESNREKGVRCKFQEKNIEKHGPPGFGCGLVNPSSIHQVGKLGKKKHTVDGCEFLHQLKTVVYPCLSHYL
jgi:hypothetical protein